MKEKLQSLKEMIIIRSKTFSLSDRIKNAKNIYNTELEIYEKDRKDPNAFSNKSEKEENDKLKSSKSRKILDKSYKYMDSRNMPIIMDVIFNVRETK